MRRFWVARGLVIGGVAMAAITVACGEGRVIINVDVLSFLKNSFNDSVAYSVPAPTPAVDSFTAPVRVNLPGGLGNSAVQSAKITLTRTITNQSGAGSVRFLIYVSADSATLYTQGRSLGDTVTFPATPSPSVHSDSISLADSLFSKSTLFVGVRAGLTATTASPVTPFKGYVKLTGVTFTIILQDKLF